MPRHTPMDSDSSPFVSDASETILRPEITHQQHHNRSTPIMRWLLVVASLSMLFFI
jgi:hypothetical protein